MTANRKVVWDSELPVLADLEFPGFSGHVAAFFLQLQSPRD